MHDAAVGLVVNRNVRPLLWGEFVEAGAKGGGRRSEVGGQRSNGGAASGWQRRERSLDGAEEGSAFLGESLPVRSRLVIGRCDQAADGSREKAKQGGLLHISEAGI